MDADTAHRFWLGKVNVTVALARGQMKAKGPVAKILKLVPLTKPIFPRYRAILEESGAARTCSRPPDGGGGPDPLARQMAGFKDFYQYVATTRVISGRDLLGSAGFEFQKEGAAPGLHRHRRGDPRHRPRRAGGGRRARRRPRGGRRVRRTCRRTPRPTWWSSCAAAAKEAGADSFLAVGGGSVMDTAKVADAVFTHGGSAREQEGFLLMPREDDGMGKPLDDRAAGVHPHHRRHRQRGVDGRGDQGPRAQGQARDRGLPAVPAARDPRSRRHPHAAARRSRRPRGWTP